MNIPSFLQLKNLPAALVVAIYLPAALCGIFIFRNAVSVGNMILKVASVNCFFIASVSSLSATLLSGGLAIYVLLAFLPPRGRLEEDVQGTVLTPVHIKASL
jgi:hypothetical protein